MVLWCFFADLTELDNQGFLNFLLLSRPFICFDFIFPFSILSLGFSLILRTPSAGKKAAAITRHDSCPKFIFYSGILGGR